MGNAITADRSRDSSTDKASLDESTHPQTPVTTTARPHGRCAPSEGPPCPTRVCPPAGAGHRPSAQRRCTVQTLSRRRDSSMSIRAPRWEATRRRILERDGYVCQIRLPGCTRVATTVDHIVPRAMGGGHEDALLRAACNACNSRRGGQMRKKKPLPAARPSRW
jgi:5-methylcytosine-specific restriction endonuclease McrA